MDVLITPDASRDLEALALLHPGPSAWGLLLGHKRGRRVFVERFFPAGTAGALPAPGRLDELDRSLGRRLVGFYAVRPAAAFRKSLLSPYAYGRLFIDIRRTGSGPSLKTYAVGFDGRFLLEPVRPAARRKGGRP